jgi:hypothetical protein
MFIFLHAVMKLIRVLKTKFWQVSRGRSYSTTTSPKVQQIESGTPSVTGHHRDILRSNSNSGECSKSVPLRRKKSVPTGRGDTRYRIRCKSDSELNFISNEKFGKNI